MRDRTGRALEKLVRVLEDRLAQREGVTITPKLRLRDRITGRLREHDVVLKVQAGHHELVVSIECRDRSRRVTQEQVEAFWKKCQDTGVAAGAIVSPSGFWKTARKKAEFLGVRCLSLSELASLEWLLTPGITTCIKKLKHVDMTVLVSGSAAGNAAPTRYFKTDGTAVPADALRSAVVSQLRDEELFAPESGEKVLPYSYPVEDLWAEIPGNRERCQVMSVSGEAVFDLEVTIAPFRLFSYADEAGAGVLGQAAVARIDDGPIRGDLIVAFKPGEGGQVVFVPDRKR